MADADYVLALAGWNKIDANADDYTAAIAANICIRSGTKGDDILPSGEDVCEDCARIVSVAGHSNYCATRRDAYADEVSAIYGYGVTEK